MGGRLMATSSPRAASRRTCRRHRQLLLDKTGTITIGNRRATELSRWVASPTATGPACRAGLDADRPPRVRAFLTFPAHLARSMARSLGLAVHRVLRADAHERRGTCQTAPGSAKEHPTPSPGTSRTREARFPRATRPPSNPSYCSEPRRWRLPKTTSWASSSLKTSSSRASVNGLTGCGRWVCAWLWSPATPSDGQGDRRGVRRRRLYRPGDPEAKLAYIRKEQQGASWWR